LNGSYPRTGIGNTIAGFSTAISRVMMIWLVVTTSHSSSSSFTLDDDDDATMAMMIYVSYDGLASE
jgi:hypothetical protein